MPTKVSLGRYDVKYGIIRHEVPFPWRTDTDLTNDDSRTEDTLYIDENTPYVLNVTLDDGDRLYLDGVEMLPNSSQDAVRTDESGELYIGQSGRFPLYDNDDTNKYLPGNYQLRLVHADNTYRAYLQIQSKYLSDKEYQRLITDIERIGTGLTESSQRGYHNVSKDSSIPRSQSSRCYLPGYH